MGNKKIYLASPRGFCAGVKRALAIVDATLEKYGTPLYVFNEIVHNDYIVNSLQNKGVIFVDDLYNIPAGSNLIYSAHGVSKEVEAAAQLHSLNTIDATCPLVKKVHVKAQRLSDSGYKVLLIGHSAHPEVIGTIGQVNSPITVIEDISCVEKLEYTSDTPLAYLTQTTLSSDDTFEIVSMLQNKYPNIYGDNDICYATQNRQDAVKSLSNCCDTIFIIGSEKSSNSNRLNEVAQKMGCDSYLINSVNCLTDDICHNLRNIGISAGASAPQCLVDEVVEFFQNRGWDDVEEIFTVEENIKFSLPKV